MKRRIQIISLFVFALLSGFVIQVTLSSMVSAAPLAQIERKGTLYLRGALRFIGASGLEMDGRKMDLDADRDTSITADTDDQIDFEVGGSDIVTIDATSGVTITTGGLTISAGPMVLGEQTEAVTATFIITPTAIFIELTSVSTYTSNTSTPIITSTAINRQQLTLFNGNASDPLTLDGTGGTVECKANVVLGPKDMVTLIYDSTDEVWYCQAGYDNS